MILLYFYFPQYHSHYWDSPIPLSPISLSLLRFPHTTLIHITLTIVIPSYHSQSYHSHYCDWDTVLLIVVFSFCVFVNNRKKEENGGKDPLQKRQLNWDTNVLPLAPLQALHLVSLVVALSLAQTLVSVQVPLSLTEGNTKHQKEVEREN